MGTPRVERAQSHAPIEHKAKIAMAAPDDPLATLFDQYVDAPATPQAAVDALPGWTTALPPEAGATAGSLALYADNRIDWAMHCFGPLAGKTVLELGPLEGSHTYMLDRAGAARIDAVEANKLAFLRCLVVKELLGMPSAHFHLGNFVRWLEDRLDRYDLIVASGVLYHLRDPLCVLELLSQRCDALFLWTHYVDDFAMPRGDPRRSVFRPTTEVRQFHGLDVRLFPRSYHAANRNVSFCGGLYDDHRWIQRDDLLAVLDRLGYDDIKLANEEPDHPNGPCFSVFAQRTRP